MNLFMNKLSFECNLHFRVQLTFYPDDAFDQKHITFKCSPDPPFVRVLVMCQMFRNRNAHYKSVKSLSKFSSQSTVTSKQYNAEQTVDIGYLLLLYFSAH